MQEIIMLAGFYGFLDAIFYKWGVWLFLEKKASTTKKRFIYEAINCLFCRTFHLLVIVAVLYQCLTGFRVEVCFYVFIVSGLIQILRRK